MTIDKLVEIDKIDEFTKINLDQNPIVDQSVDYVDFFELEIDKNTSKFKLDHYEIDSQ